MDLLPLAGSLYERRATLGESPRWDSDSETLYWVDIDEGIVWAGSLGARGHPTEVAREPGPIGAIVLDADGRILWAAGNRWRGPGKDDHWPWALDRLHLRFNDAGVDADGVIWSATMRLDETVAEVPDAVLYRVSSKSADPVAGGIGIGNGIAWSPDGSWMYLVDSSVGVLRAPFELGSGPVGDWTLWGAIRRGMPDGIAVDADGGVWVACWGAGDVLRFDEQAKVTHRLSLPTKTVTALTFAGSDLDVIVCTTSSQRISPKQDPLAGRLFVADAPVPGLELFRARAR